MKEEKKKVRRLKPSCETCEYYDWDDEMQDYICTIDMDEDDAYRFRAHQDVVCTYYKFYDEYKSVQKQN